MKKWVLLAALAALVLPSAGWAAVGDPCPAASTNNTSAIEETCIVICEGGSCATDLDLHSWLGMKVSGHQFDIAVLSAYTCSAGNVAFYGTRQAGLATAVKGRIPLNTSYQLVLSGSIVNRLVATHSPPRYITGVDAATCTVEPTIGLTLTRYKEID